jgi:hypothetical protein
LQRIVKFKIQLSHDSTINIVGRSKHKQSCSVPNKPNNQDTVPSCLFGTFAVGLPLLRYLQVVIKIFAMLRHLLARSWSLAVLRHVLAWSWSPVVLQHLLARSWQANRDCPDCSLSILTCLSDTLRTSRSLWVRHDIYFVDLLNPKMLWRCQRAFGATGVSGMPQG